MSEQLGKLTSEAAKNRMCLRAKIALDALGIILDSRNMLCILCYNTF